jgi:hypothetical protein
VYDKEREDGNFTPQDPVQKTTDSPSWDGQQPSPKPWDPIDSIFVTMPPWHPVSSGAGLVVPTKDKVAKNPVSHWRVSRRAVVGMILNSHGILGRLPVLQISYFPPMLNTLLPFRRTGVSVLSTRWQSSEPHPKAPCFYSNCILDSSTATRPTLVH